MTNPTEVKVVTADPGPLGLFGLAIVTLVASSQKLGLTEGTSLLLPWAFFAGGLAQLMAAAYDFKKNNVFGGTAFAAYGFFWCGMSLTWLVKLGVLGEAAMAGADGRQTGVAFVGYLIFTVFMTIGAMRTNKVLFSIFALIILLFVGLSISSLVPGAEHGFFHNMAAYAELLISLLSFYGSAAGVLNSQTNRPVLPVGKALIS